MTDIFELIRTLTEKIWERELKLLHARKDVEEIDANDDEDGGDEYIENKHAGDTELKE